VNGDGADDVFVGAPGHSSDTGRAYYYKGYDDTDADGDTYNATDDCDDTNPAIHPGAVEVCDAANADEDCNGVADDAAATGQSTFYADSDSDNYGDPANPISACDAPEGYVVDKTDCDDTKYAVNPKATEVCNGFDDNCDGSTDGDDAEEPLIWYEDADGDGYPNPDSSTTQCAQPDGYVKLGEDDDCDDNDATSHPYAEEVAGDGIDQDCDGADLPDEGGCKGCASGGPGPAWLLGLAALGVLRRRR
jgi:MYXO-CTERM domain-containing protein